MIEEVSNDQVKAAKHFLAFIEVIRKIDPEMQMQTALVLLFVMIKPGRSMRELEQVTGLATSSISRNVAALGKIHRKGVPGHDLLLTKEDPMDRRVKLVYPTARGRRVFSEIMELMG